MRGTEIKPGGTLKTENLISTYKPPHWKKPKRIIFKNNHLLRIFTALFILTIFLALKETDNPWGVEVRENLRSVLTTEWNYQPVFDRVVQFGLALASSDWPLISDPQPVITSNGVTSAPEILQIPVSGKVVRGYGMLPDPIDNMERFHPGIDIAAPVGSPVKAVKDGTVQKLGDCPELGKYILIDHGNGSFSLYGELARLIVKEGQTVQAGQVIGEVGAAKNIPGGGLHFELREDYKLVDPLTKMQL